MDNNRAVNQPTLKYNVLLEKTSEAGYTARVLAWPDLVVKAATREEALAQIRAVLLERLAKAEIVTLEIQPEELKHSWLPFAGMWADNPDLDEFRAEIDRYRHEVDAIHAPWLLETEEKSEQETQPDPEAVVA